MSIDPNTFLMGGGVPSAKFDGIGVTVTGVIDDITASQQTDFTTGEPKTWPNGDPMMQVVVTLATDQRDPDISDDDGLRKVYVKGKSLTNAVRDAVRRAGAKGLEVGGTLTVTYTGDGVSERRGINPPKLYAAEYAKPNPAAAANAALGLADSQPAPAGPTPVAASLPGVAATAAGGTDLSQLSPEARAVVEQMLAAQQQPA
jgi:hypothetical protein